MRVVVLGAGFGGLEVCTRLSEALGGDGDVDIVLVDRSDAFIAGAAHIAVLAGAATLSDVRHPYAGFVHPGVRFVHSDVHRIDVAGRTVETSVGTLHADVLVIALGAELDTSATPGLSEAGREFYTVPGAVATHRALTDFDGGHVLIAVCGVPYKCPPAPAEAALVIHDTLVDAGIRDRSEISLVMPTDRPIGPSVEASDAVLAAFAERNIAWQSNTRIDHLDPGRKVAVTDRGEDLKFDLFLGVPVHRAPTVVAAAGLCPDGWVTVDPNTMRTIHHGIYAIGDIVDVGAPKAGVFAVAQAAVVAERIIANHRGDNDPVRASDRGVCYLDIGAGQTTGIDVTFTPGAGTSVVLHRPSAETSAAKMDLITGLMSRWFTEA